MGQVPSTALQAALLVMVILPGFIYQFLRERLRGPVEGERDLGERALRAVAVSILLDALYAIVAGPELVRLFRGTDPADWNGLAQRPRMAGLAALVLFVGIPSVAAGGISAWERRRRRTRYCTTPTAWDHMFRSQGSCFVRLRLRDGSWIGGWYGAHSYATSYPQPPELFLESAWRMNPDGSFAHRIGQTAGLYVRMSDTDMLELLHPGEEDEDR